MSDVERAEHAAFGERFAYIPDRVTKVYDDKVDELDALLRGVMMRRLVRFEYMGAKGRAQRGILAVRDDPLQAWALTCSAGTCAKAKIPRCCAPRKPMNYAAERFVDADFGKNSSFTPPQDFRLDDYVHGAFGVHVGDASEAKEVVVFSAARGTMRATASGIRRRSSKSCRTATCGSGSPV
jgi:hypothetical protein